MDDSPWSARWWEHLMNSAALVSFELRMALPWRDRWFEHRKDLPCRVPRGWWVQMGEEMDY
jgi:hypothetical protein